MTGLLIEKGSVLTMDEQDRVHCPGWLWLEEGRIGAVGEGQPPADLSARAGRVIDATGMAVLPGMVNGHTHLEQSFQRGMGDGLPLLRWLSDMAWPMERAMTADEVYLAARLSLVEQLKSGVTTVVQHHKVTRSDAHVDAVARAAEELGVRLLLARLWADLGAGGETPAEIIERTGRLRDRWHGAAGGRITVGFGPAVPWRCSDEGLRRTVAQARAWGIPSHIHVAEGRSEDRQILKRTGKRNIEWLASLGALGPDVHLVHMIWLDDRELDLVAETGSPVVHCPVSNLYIAAGIAPVHKMLDRGISVSLGTDGSGSGGRQNMLEAAKLALLLARVSAGDPGALLPMTALRMATANGARQLGRADLGRLAPGAAADVVLVRLDTLHATPMVDPAAALVYGAGPADVHTVIVDGRLLLEGGKVAGLDEPELIRECAEAAGELRRRANVPASPHGRSK